MANRIEALQALSRNMYAVILDEIDEKQILSEKFQKTWLEAFNKGIENIDKLFLGQQCRELEKLQRVRGE